MKKYDKDNISSTYTRGWVFRQGLKLFIVYNTVRFTLSSCFQYTISFAVNLDNKLNNILNIYATSLWEDKIAYSDTSEATKPKA